MAGTHRLASVTIADWKLETLVVTTAGLRSMQVVWSVTTADWERQAVAQLQSKVKRVRMLNVARMWGRSSKELAGCSPARRPTSLESARKGSQSAS
jgi:hypothetical protein